ncbi:MAG: GGDEF domain-containing protein [Timaviella obliquedivisa GSE-PSE-MK23-08B]|nr:GGDEF domain-containing protein [Timaviella obliquedivisa GSE-PSE-MK23-08B]
MKLFRLFKIPGNAKVKKIAIGAYVGVPIVYDDGALFGTLCAIHPTSQPEAIVAELPLIELLAKLLSSLLNADLKSSEQARCAEQARVEALTDILSGLYNRRGWDQLLVNEEKRCRQYGHPACIIAIDLDGLKQVNDTQGHAKGDELIHKAGQTVRQAIRKQDIAARVGGDEFAILCVECSLINGEALMERIKTTLALHPVDASLGIAVRKPNEGLFETWEEADRAMYFCKRSRRL